MKPLKLYHFIHQMAQRFESMPVKTLRTLARTFGIPGSRKAELVDALYQHYCDIRMYVHYTFLKQLGSQGRDGRTFLVRHDQKHELYALKLFHATKPRVDIDREVHLQRRAARYGLAPRLVDVDLDGRYIVMERLQHTLYDKFCSQGYRLTLAQQTAILQLLDRMDAAGIYHADPNPLNFMQRGRKWFLIDYGFAKRMDSTVIAKWGPTPNRDTMVRGLLVYLDRVSNHDAECDLFRQHIRT